MIKSTIAVVAIFLCSFSDSFSQKNEPSIARAPSYQSVVTFDNGQSLRAAPDDEIALIVIIGENGYLFKNLENKEFDGQISPQHIAGLHVITSPEQSINVIGFEKKAIAIILDEASQLDIAERFKLNRRQLKSVLADLSIDKATI